MPSPLVRRSQRPVTFATAVLVITGLPALGAAFMAAAYLFSFAAGTGATPGQALTFAPLLVAPVGALCAYVALLRSATTRRAWLWSGITVALLLVASVPLAISFGQALLGEWCESAPGGRGFSGPAGAPDEVPLLCR